MSQKRNIISADFLDLEQHKALISLFSMYGIDPEIRQRFLEIEQQKALKIM